MKHFLTNISSLRPSMHQIPYGLVLSIFNIVPRQTLRFLVFGLQYRTWTCEIIVWYTIALTYLANCKELYVDVLSLSLRTLLNTKYNTPNTFRLANYLVLLQDNVTPSHVVSAIPFCNVIHPSTLIVGLLSLSLIIHY